jgi:hypothetical protein
MYEKISYINLGLAGVFIGLVVIAFSPSDVINSDVYMKTILSYQSPINNMVEALNLEGKPIYIPPYRNLQMEEFSSQNIKKTSQ